MKTGTIVYLAGAGTLPEDFDAEGAIEAAGLASRWTEMSGSAPGFYRPEEALLALARRGAARVELVWATFDAQAGLIVGAEHTRLIG